MLRNKLKNKNHMITSIDVEKSLYNIKKPFIIKKRKTQKSGYRGNIAQYNKAIYNKTTANITFSSEKLKTFPLKPRPRQGCSLSTLLFNIVCEVLITAITEGKESNWKQKSRTFTVCSCVCSVMSDSLRPQGL